MPLALITLFTGLAISAVAIYYSVLGLAAIFAAAVIPIYIMGTILEISKLVTAWWLKANWTRAPLSLKLYLTAAVIILMFITSMGIFGFLSQAHSDQSLVSGDVQSKIALYDEQIKTARENIDANRKALKQMDEAVDQVMARSSSETGADKSVAIRRSQLKERARLQSEIQAEQKAISRLSQERAPIAAEVRKVEAEVGPIKYIAAFVYGDNTDTNLLEKAVTWVIIIIVAVFDPLAVLLLLASQLSFQWAREQRANKLATTEPIIDTPPPLPPLVPVVEVDLAAEANAKIAEIERPEFEFTVPVATDHKVTEKKVEEPIIFEVIELPPDVDAVAKEIIEDSSEDDSLDMIEAKRLWKESHPDDTLKNQRRLLDAGVINSLPWEDPIYLKKSLTYMEKVGKHQIQKPLSET